LGWGDGYQGDLEAGSAHPNSHHLAGPEHSGQSWAPITRFINSLDTSGKQ